MRKAFIPGGILFILLFACREEQSTPRPRAYPRIEYPKRELQHFSSADCPFTFSFPTYAEVNLKTDHPCWFDLYMPVFKARLHCSYLPIKNRADYDDMVEDAFTIAAKINERANYMQDSLIQNPQGVGGLALQWTGPAASPLHFFLTDTTTHFFKASLYFEAEVRPDSLKPVIRFVEEDMHDLIQSFAWKK